MKRVRISAARWQTPADAHRALAAGLDFPAHYGNNLDALHDCLTDLTDTELIVEQCALAEERMPEKWRGFLAVFLDAAEENPGLRVKLVLGDADYIENTSNRKGRHDGL